MISKDQPRIQKLGPLKLFKAATIIQYLKLKNGSNLDLGFTTWLTTTEQKVVTQNKLVFLNYPIASSKSQPTNSSLK